MNAEAPTIAAAPRKPRRRRWLRFSLRTMLVAMAAVGILFAFVIGPATRQKRAVELIKTARGSFAYLSGDNDYPFIEHREAPRGLGWLRNLIGIDFFQTVGDVTVGRDDSPTTHRAIDALGDLPHLRTLDIMNADLTDAEMAELEKLPLRQLYIQWCKITPEGWKSIGRIKTLEQLCLRGQDVGDAALSNVGPLTNITELDLTGTSVTKAGLAELKNMPHLKSVELDQNPQLTTQAIANLHKSMPTVRLSANGLPEIDEVR